MKKQILNLKTLALLFSILLLAFSCSDDDAPKEVIDEISEEGSRWITVAAARMGEEPGDGNGGTLIYSVSSEDAKDPTVSIEAFENGFITPSNRTARLQSSEDGNTIFNISYAGDTGGNYTKYLVEGGR